MRGRITKRWTETQHKYSTNRGYNIWTLKFIQLLQKVNQKIWELRNNLIYGNGKEKASKEQNRLTPTITTYYNTYKQMISVKYYHIFNIPLEQGITFSPPKNLQRINTYKAAKTYYKREQKEFYNKHTKITRFFRPQKRPFPHGDKHKGNTHGKSQKKHQTHLRSTTTIDSHKQQWKNTAHSHQSPWMHPHNSTGQNSTNRKSVGIGFMIQ